MDKRKVLILGGNGFIGSNLAAYFSKKGEDVTSFDVEGPDKCIEGVDYVVGDFFDDESLRTQVLKHDVIYHAVSTVNPGNSNEKYLRGYSGDMIQTIKLCSWIKDLPISMIFLSSGGTVYGHQEKQPISEDQLARPINHYGNIKLCIENALRIFHIQNRLNIRIARISNPYGPGQDYTKGVGFIDAAVKRTLQNNAIDVWGDGNNIRDYIYIDDVCFYLRELAGYKGEEIIFNISSGVGYSQKDIIEVLAKHGLQAEIQWHDARTVDVRRIILDNTRLISSFGNQIRPLEEGITEYIKYLKVIE